MHVHETEPGFRERRFKPARGGVRAAVSGTGRYDMEEFAISEPDLEAIYAEYDELARKYIEMRRSGDTWFNFYHFMVDLDNGPCIAKRVSGCSAGASTWPSFRTVRYTRPSVRYEQGLYNGKRIRRYTE
jgi:hypothetical protein